MSRSLWKKALTFWGFLTCSGALAASPGFVSCGYTLPMGVRVNCDNSVVTISVNMRTWRYSYMGSNAETKIVLSRYLLLSAANSGTLSFTMSYLFDLRSGQKVFEDAASLLYEDKQRIVLIPSDTRVGHWDYQPEMGIFSKNSQELKRYSYVIKPRPGCGMDEYDVGPVKDEDFIGSAKGFSFVRSDNCGRFVVSYPWPK